MPARVLDGKGNPIALASLTGGACGPTKEQQQHAMFAALASQTLLKRMGLAFWEAFSGAPGPSPSGPGSGSVVRGWDADKVRRVLEGKAVVRVVDVESAPAVVASGAVAKERSAGRCEPKCITELLEGMSGLGKKCL
jgi:hypothetical protein